MTRITANDFLPGSLEWYLYNSRKEDGQQKTETTSTELNTSSDRSAESSGSTTDSSSTRSSEFSTDGSGSCSDSSGWSYVSWIQTEWGPESTVEGDRLPSIPEEKEELPATQKREFKPSLELMRVIKLDRTAHIFFDSSKRIAVLPTRKKDYEKLKIKQIDDRFIGTDRILQPLHKETAFFGYKPEARGLKVHEAIYLATKDKVIRYKIGLILQGANSKKKLESKLLDIPKKDKPITSLLSTQDTLAVGCKSGKLYLAKELETDFAVFSDKQGAACTTICSRPGIEKQRSVVFCGFKDGSIQVYRYRKEWKKELSIDKLTDSSVTCLYHVDDLLFCGNEKGEVLVISTENFEESLERGLKFTTIAMYGGIDSPVTSILKEDGIACTDSAYIEGSLIYVAHENGQLEVLGWNKHNQTLSPPLYTMSTSDNEKILGLTRLGPEEIYCYTADSLFRV